MPSNEDPCGGEPGKVVVPSDLPFDEATTDTRPEGLATGDRLPLIILAKALDYQAESLSSRLDRAGKRKSAQALRELAIRLRAR
jgi:hypothetical protein